MNSDDLETIEALVERYSVAEISEALAEICRNRGNIQREDGPPYPDSARRWTHCGAVLFDATDQLKRFEP